MAYFAELDEHNVVLRVIRVDDANAPDPAPSVSEPAGIAFLSSIGLGSNWKQTSYNANFRKNYAGIGYTYDGRRDAFIEPKPFDSWVLNEDTCMWDAPIPKPEGDYEWNEEAQTWNTSLTS